MADAICSISDVYENLRAVKGNDYTYLIDKVMTLGTTHDLMIKAGIPTPLVNGLCNELAELILHHAKTLNIDLNDKSVSEEFARNVSNLRGVTS